MLVIQANDGQSGKIVSAGNVEHDGVSLEGLPVPVMSQYAPNYTLYHELAHAVDLSGFTRRDLYNLRDGLRQKATSWTVAANGEITRAGSVTGEIALELDANWFAAGAAVSAYRDQNGELRLANYDLSSADRPLLKKTASAGLGSDVSVSQVSPLRVVTAVRSGGGSLKLIAFDISAAGELTRRGSYTAGGATEMNVVTINSSRIVAAVRQAGGHLKVICFDISADGEFTRRGHWEAGTATDIDLARVSLRRVATSVRSAEGTLKVILFEVDAEGEVIRLGSYQGGPVCDQNVQCTDRSAPLEADFTSRTSITGLAALRMAVSYIDPDTLLQVRTLDIQDDGMTLTPVGSQSSTGTYLSTRLVRRSATVFTTLGQLDGQVWTGNGFGLLGGNTGDNVVHFDPYTKLKLGWLPFTEVDSSMRVGLIPMGYDATQAVILRVPGHRETEYFILEVRQKGSLYESGLKDEGLAIWHVDEEKVYPHPYVSLEWLGGSPETALWSEADAGLLLYDDSSSPAGSRWSDFSTSGVSISDIEEFLGIVSFTVEIR